MGDSCVFYLWNSAWSSHWISQFGHLQRPWRNKQLVLSEVDFSSVSMEIGCWFNIPVKKNSNEYKSCSSVAVSHSVTAESVLIFSHNPLKISCYINLIQKFLYSSRLVFVKWNSPFIAVNTISFTIQLNMHVQYVSSQQISSLYNIYTHRLSIQVKFFISFNLFITCCR